MADKEKLIAKLKPKELRIGILGLGYVGLPLAVIFAEAGFSVTGIDPDSRKVESLTMVSVISRMFQQSNWQNLLSMDLSEQPQISQS